MVDTKFSEVRDVVTEMTGAATADQSGVLPHLRWELLQVMSRVRPEDLSAAEIAALLLVLTPAHSRVIGGPALRPGLRVVGIRGEHPAPNLA
ncbi:MAG: hypothetical protein QOG37_1532 [Mycobacterium sp.]|jgi:hypothetical protein|nr:hypothetical protein [Mycobacterium sp.]MDT5174281.1 hypothetical protein [Mycobacterium sp.]